MILYSNYGLIDMHGKDHVTVHNSINNSFVIVDNLIPHTITHNIPEKWWNYAFGLNVMTNALSFFKRKRQSCRLDNIN